jgi:predicted ATPase/DNA-binding CsgD family transcriptional regulator
VKRNVLTRLPAEVTSFVGRRQERAEVKRLLSLARLVTLTGVGGVGKTRLAFRTAADLQKAFSDGVYVAQLADLNDPELLEQVVVSAVGIRDPSGHPFVALTSYLGDDRALLVLDNCEHLPDACGHFVSELLRACPQLRVLTTSREALRIEGEHLFVVPPLSTPDPGEPLTPSRLQRYEATNLLVDRAAAVLPDFSVTQENCAAVAQLCQTLDGIPLSVELAAARLPGLSPKQIVHRLEDRFHLLTEGDRQAPARHQNLSALIEWSFELCSPEEQLLWARASIFPGSFDLPAAEAICSGGELTRDRVLETVAGLVTKSILIRDENTGEARYRMLETIRQYGRPRLAEPDSEESLQRRHREWYYRVASRAKQEWFGANQPEWLARLQSDHANLRAALDLSFASPKEARTGLDLAASLWFYWIATGFLTEGRRWLHRGLELDREASPARNTALWVAAWLAAVQGDFQAATAMLDEARAMGRSRGDSAVLAYVAQTEGMSALLQNDLPRARGLFEEALGRHRLAEDPAGVANDLMQLCVIASLEGDPEGATTFGQECLSIYDAYGERWYKSYALCDLGISLWQQGNADEAAAVERESLLLSRSFNQKLGIGMSVEVLAWIAVTNGDFGRAAHLLGALQEIWRAIGVPESGLGHFTGYHEQCVARAREELGEQEFDHFRSAGEGFDLDELVAYALDEHSPRERDSATPTPLTPRELEVAELLGKGKTNKEIATILLIAPRTAEGHVEHILTKLGFATRTQVAAWVAQCRVAGDTPGGS